MKVQNKKQLLALPKIQELSHQLSAHPQVIQEPLRDLNFKKFSKLMTSMYMKRMNPHALKRMLYQNPQRTLKPTSNPHRQRSTRRSYPSPSRTSKSSACTSPPVASSLITRWPWIASSGRPSARWPASLKSAAWCARWERPTSWPRAMRRLRSSRGSRRSIRPTISMCSMCR